MTDYYGHKTMADGTRVPLTKDETADLWGMVKQDKAELAESMPTTQDALRMVNKAMQRLRDLGWLRGGGFAVKKGDECAVCEFGSTGIWRGWMDEDGKYFQYAGGVSSRQKVWAKPLSDLTDDERKHMEECDRESVGYMEGEFYRWATEDEGDD